MLILCSVVFTWNERFIFFVPSCFPGVWIPDDDDGYGDEDDNSCFAFE